MDSKLTSRQVIDIKDVIRHPGWQYFVQSFLPSQINASTERALETPTGIDGYIRREQMLGEINLSKEIVERFLNYIEINTEDDEEV